MADLETLVDSAAASSPCSLAPYLFQGSHTSHEACSEGSSVQKKPLINLSSAHTVNKYFILLSVAAAPQPSSRYGPECLRAPGQHPQPSSRRAFLLVSRAAHGHHHRGLPLQGWCRVGGRWQGQHRQLHQQQGVQQDHPADRQRVPAAVRQRSRHASSRRLWWV